MTKERPILFSGSMVRAILDRRKTETRRPIRPQPVIKCWDKREFIDAKCPFGVPGDRLWVRETFGLDPDCDSPYYRATEEHTEIFPKGYWKPSIHMPRWASRIDLEITDVKVERLQEITEQNAQHEGLTYEFWGTWWQGYRRIDDEDEDSELLQSQWLGDKPPEWMIEPKRMKDRPDLDSTALRKFCGGWDFLYSKQPEFQWSANPWVWVIQFKRVRP